MEFVMMLHKFSGDFSILNIINIED